ncbi:PHP domain-containing protein [bacterium]
MQWFKGNLHTHAREGESDSSVEDVANWYKNHGYQFLVITDHSVVTFPPSFSTIMDSSFLLIPGIEVVGKVGKDVLEINGLNIHEDISPIRDDTIPKTLQTCIDVVRRQNGVPLINHPNYQWRLSQEVILGAENCYLFEVNNAFPGIHNEGNVEHPGLEEVWDFLLTSGKHIYGVASDDAHSYQEFSPELSNPGRGWVMVKAWNLDIDEIMRNLDSGLFYSSTGVKIAEINVQPFRIEIVIQETENTAYKTDFIGSEGKVLLSTTHNPAVYNLSSERHYVRGKITDSNGCYAWLQPVFVVQ